MTKEDESDVPTLGRAGFTPASPTVATLSEEDCWGLLRSHNLGRLAIVVDGRPRIFPMNYAAGKDAVLDLVPVEEVTRQRPRALLDLRAVRQDA